MGVWLKERVLQRYVLENKHKFKPHGQKIINIRDNKDRYPDLYCILEDGTEIPAEVEWKTSNFIHHGHDVKLLRDNHGILLVCVQDQQIGFDIPQIKIEIEDFEKWFMNNAKKIISDTTFPYKNPESSRKIPKLFLSYLSLKAGGVSDFELALQYGTWGVQEKYSSNVINQISSIQEGDLIGFVGPAKGFPGRVDLQKWMKRSFVGRFERARVFRVTRGYFLDKSKIIWNGNGKWKGEIFPHRFEFDPNPIIDLTYIPIKKLSETAKREMHSMLYGNFISASPSTLVDLIFFGKHNLK